MTSLPWRREAVAVIAAQNRDTRLRRLKGHSGARLELLEDGRIVRKTAADTKHNARLLAQAALQRRLLRYGIPFPHVLAQGMDREGLAYFEMEYVPTDDIATMIRSGAPFAHGEIVTALERLFRFFSLTRKESLPAALFHGKIEQIVAVCSTLPCCAEGVHDIAVIADRLKTRDWSGVPSSVCHGDLTLENILCFPARGLVFLDCDDGFAPSYWLDAAKLFQDVAGHWCLRDLYIADKRDIAAQEDELGRLDPVLRAMLSEADGEIVGRLPQLTALQLFRTLPYAKDDALVHFVLRRIDHLLDGHSA